MSVPTAIEVAIVKEADTEDLPLPGYATSGAAGMDLCAALPADQPITLSPGERATVSTGIRIAVPPGYEAQVRPRSGLAARHGVTTLNAPGTIDCDYRGVIHVVLINFGQHDVTFRRGDRIAQLVVAPYTRVTWSPVSDLDDTTRGRGGFGSTGGTG